MDSSLGIREPAEHTSPTGRPKTRFSSMKSAPFSVYHPFRNPFSRTAFFQNHKRKWEITARIISRLIRGVQFQQGQKNRRSGDCLLFVMSIFVSVFMYLRLFLSHVLPCIYAGGGKRLLPTCR